MKLCLPFAYGSQFLFPVFVEPAVAAIGAFASGSAGAVETAGSIIWLTPFLSVDDSFV